MRVLEGCLVRVLAGGLEGCSTRLGRGCLVVLVSVLLRLVVAMVRRSARRALAADVLRLDAFKRLVTR